MYTSHGLIKKNTSQGVCGDGVADRAWSRVYVEEQVGYGGCEIVGCEEKSGIFFLFGKSTKQETSTDREINTKKQNL